MNDYKLALEKAKTVLEYTQTIESNFDADLCAQLVEDALFTINNVLKNLIDYETIVIKNFSELNPYKEEGLPRLWINKYEVCIKFNHLSKAENCKEIIADLRYIPIAKIPNQSIEERHGIK